MNIIEEIEKHWGINGDKLQFKNLESASYDVIRGNLTRYAYGKLKNWMDAEDAVQDAYLHALTYPPKGEGHNFGGLFKLWLDQSISNIRSRNQGKNLLEDDSQITYETEEGDSIVNNIIDNEESPELTPDQAVNMADTVEFLMDLSDNLKPKAKRIVRLVFVFGYSYKEVERIESVTHKQIDNTLTYFRHKIRTHPQYTALMV